MKTFIGVPATEGRPASVTVVDQSGAIKLPGVHGWGKSLHAAATAKAILMDCRGPDDAVKYHRRFMWRALASVDASKPWKMTMADVETVLGDIMANEPAIRANAARVMQSPAPVVSEGGVGPGGSAFSPIKMK